MAVVENGNHSVVMRQGVYMQGDLASKRSWDGSSNWDCMYFHIGHQLVAYFGPQHWRALSLNPLPK